MWWMKKKSKKVENISQLLLGIGIALMIFNLPIVLRAHLSVSVNESLTGIVIGVIFLAVGLLIGVRK